jgi:hypothetical protein
MFFQLFLKICSRNQIESELAIQQEYAQYETARTKYAYNFLQNVRMCTEQPYFIGLLNKIPKSWRGHSLIHKC